MTGSRAGEPYLGTDCRKLARSFSRRDVGHQDARGRAKVACRRLCHLFEVIGIPDHRVVSVRRADSRADDSGAQVGELRVMLIAAPGVGRPILAAAAFLGG
jgi:hypothetical protein